MHWRGLTSVDEFVVWQEFLYVAYGPLIISVVAGVIAAGILVSFLLIVLDVLAGRSGY